MGYGCRGCGEDDAKCYRDGCKTCCYCERPLEEAPPEANEDEKVLRQLLWLHHGCPPHTLYGDDGEMQCNNPTCMIDFKRMSPSEIQSNWARRGRVLIEEAGGMDAILASISKGETPKRPSQEDCPKRQAHGANGLVGCSKCGWQLV